MPASQELEAMERARTSAATLLWVLWRGVSLDLKHRYRRTIWEQFEATIRASAYTESLGRFVEVVCLKLQATIGATALERALAFQTMQESEARVLLKLLREETALLVLMVRLRSQERKERAEETIRDAALERRPLGASREEP